ncbi:DNA-binding protein, putative [Litoreibacter arenae DSM 19593]|uniref:DNA-binding protein, putative n=1 Tax=Litoreibacter arenae DSM 19593 TaxID=1123360 RepID=S9S4U3_9RHOB|nr:DNA-binding protein, putative [Litoreibacter arenae DSM 19593]
MRQRRWLVGKTQGELAEALGIRFQQVQKYESGANRISASRLWDIAQALSVSVGYFFEGLEQEGAGAGKEGQNTQGSTAKPCAHPTVRAMTG